MVDKLAAHPRFYRFRLNAQELLLNKQTHIYKPGVLLEESNDYWLQTDTACVCLTGIQVSFNAIAKSGLDHKAHVSLCDCYLAMVDGHGQRYWAMSSLTHVATSTDQRILPGESVGVFYTFNRADGRLQENLPTQPWTVMVIPRNSPEKVLKSVTLTVENEIVR